MEPEERLATAEVPASRVRSSLRRAMEIHLSAGAPYALAVLSLTLIVASHASTATQAAQAYGRSAVSGRVADATTGEPISGALVALSGPGFRGAAFLTDRQGRFVFDSLPPGQYTISAQKLGYFDGMFAETAIPTDPFAVRLGLGGLRRLVLGDGEWYQDAVVRLNRPASIAGHIFDEQRRPAALRTVRVLSVDPSGEQPPALAAASLTDDMGAFSVGRLSKGSVRGCHPRPRAGRFSSADWRRPGIPSHLLPKRLPSQ